VERTERYPAVLWVAAQEYRCHLNSDAGDYASSWLVELAYRFDMVAAREMLSETPWWPAFDASGHVACVLAACADPMTLWAAARMSSPTARRDWVQRAGIVSECLVRESVGYLVHEVVPAFLEGVGDLLGVLRSSLSPGATQRQIHPGRQGES